MGRDMLNAMKYISTVPFSGLFNWSVQYLNDSKIAFSKAYPMMRIGEFLKRNKTAVAIEDDKTYKRATIKVRNGGIFLRDEEIGSKIGTKNQFLISKGQFLLSKIDARNGAFGVVPEVLDGGIITGNFWTFDVDYNIINPHYLALLTTTEAFVQFCEQASNGTTNRHYLQEPLFLNIKVPVPSLEEQNKLVEGYNMVIAKAEALVKECQEIDLSILRYFNKSVGLMQSTRQVKLLSTMRYADISNRWDPFAVTNGLSADVPIYPLGSFITDIATGTTPPTTKREYFNGNIKFYTPSDISGRLYLTNSERTLTKKAIEDKKARVFHKGDILFVGIGSTVGKVGIVQDEIVSSNQQITGFKLNTDLLSPEYAFYYLHYHKDLTTIEQSKTTLPIVNQEKIVNIPIPVPTMS
jgi:type I restriction enzyme S subunit